MQESDSAHSSCSGDSTLTIPREITEGVRLVTDNPEAVEAIQLARGQYRISAKMPYDGKTPVHVREVAKALQLDDEFKRVYFYKISLVPLDEEHEGEKLARLTAVFHVVDNPIWIVPAIKAATVAIGAVGTWFVVDKVETFTTKSLAGTAITLAAALGTLFLLWRGVSA